MVIVAHEHVWDAGGDTLFMFLTFIPQISGDVSVFLSTILKAKGATCKIF